MTVIQSYACELWPNSAQQKELQSYFTVWKCYMCYECEQSESSGPMCCSSVLRVQSIEHEWPSSVQFITVQYRSSSSLTVELLCGQLIVWNSSDVCMYSCV